MKLHGKYVLVFSRFVGCRCHRTLRMVFPLGGGVNNDLGLKFHVIKLKKER